MLTNGARCTREIKSRIAMTKEAFYKKKVSFASKLDLNLRKKLVKLLHLENSFVRCGAWGGVVVKALRY
jgi:hypothetical protein